MGTDRTEVAPSFISSGTPSGPAPSMLVSSERAWSRDLPVSWT
jgi:hypothetical protein